MTVNIKGYFPILIADGSVLSSELTRRIVDATPKLESGDKRSLQGDSWRSRLDVHTLHEEPFSSLSKAIQTFSESAFRSSTRSTSEQKWTLEIGECWINALAKGGYNTPHDHYGFNWSGVVWLDAEGSSEERHRRDGLLEFYPPFQGSAFGLASSLSFVPKNGHGLFFPSALRHMVHPVGNRTRLSVAWNCTIKTTRANPS